jgi:cell fate regulator YaaT (PSP1 superfamily)/nitrite reductase/ring-hydroxylating ferredoxin subunit
MSYFTNIRYGKMRMVARFKTDREDLRTRDRCVIRTDRGKEVGEVLSPLQPIPEAIPAESLWDVVRRAGPEDLQHADRLETESVPQARKICREVVQKLNLPMKITDVDYVWGGERIIFYFTSTTRVDFRELVRQLAHEFRTRIELKQVGARDEARLVGDAGHCGLDLCCRGHLKELGGITMDMAKIQKHTADPSKITGRCGKLLCCLRYEYTTYTESRDLLPPRGTRLETKKGNGIVVDQNMLLREVTMVPDGGGDRFIVKLEEIQGSPAPVAGCNGCATPKVGEAPPSARPTGGEPAAVAAPATPPTPTRPVEAPRLDTAVQKKLTEETQLQTRVVAEPVILWLGTVKTAEVPPGASKVFDLGGPKIAIFNVDGIFHVTSNECSHQAGPLGEGKLEGFSVTCPLHQWKFDVTTGHCLSVSGSSVRRYESSVLGEELFVKV